MLRPDMPEVLAIESASFDYPWPEKEFVRVLRKYKNCIGMVAERDEKVVGYMIYALYKSRIDLLNFAVAEDFRRRGFGRRMIKKLIAKLSPGCRRRLLLKVRETNLPAQLFFREIGFRAVAVLRDFYLPYEEDAYSFEFHVLRETFTSK
jgi:ribosomal-protein-alanine N-acetyltransferase